MSENKHTPEPWSVDPDSTDYYASILDADGGDTILLGDYVNWWMTKANARRIVACVNACSGISTDNLEDNLPVKELARRYNEALKQRDELNRLCEFNEKTMQFLLDVINHIIDEAKLTSSQYELCRQAIARAKGEQ